MFIPPPPISTCGTHRVDFEQHKRLRENIWQIPAHQAGVEDPEFDKAWDETSDMNEDDYEIMREENEILRGSIV